VHDGVALAEANRVPAVGAADGTQAAADVDERLFPADLDEAARLLVGRLKDVGAERVCVGVGISTAQQVRDVAQYADGAIVGSHLVTALSDDGVAGVSRVTAELASGVSHSAN
jgi:hypothetical protein